MSTEHIEAALTLKQRMVLAALPYFRNELPGWGRLLRICGGFDDNCWINAPRRRLKGKWHGYEMDLDLKNWSERQTFFLGRFYDLPTQLLLMNILKEGDVFIDVGANIGMITLLASRLVGDAGQVIAFEPNPNAAARLSATIEENHISNVVLHLCALAAQDGEATLSVVTSHSGMGTIADIPKKLLPLVSAVHKVKIVRGADLLTERSRPPAVIKLDVEGYELQALQGLEPVLARHKPLVVTEVIPEFLDRAGDSLQKMLDFMNGLAFVPYELATTRYGVRRKLKLIACNTTDYDFQNSNILWCPESSIMVSRIEKLLP